MFNLSSSKLHTKKQPFNWSDLQGDILAQLHWLELLFPELQSRCWGPSADICHKLVETREFPRTFITCDYYVCFSVVYNSYHFRKRAHLLPVASKSLSFSSLIHSVTLTLYAPIPSVPVHTSFCHVFLSTLLAQCVSIAAGKALLRPGCIRWKSVSLISRISFLLFYFSICFLRISICVLCNSHHSTIPNPSPWRALKPEVMVCCLSLRLFLVF